MGILDRRFNEVGYAVVDLETTGFRPGFDEIVEVAVVWVTPEGAPSVVLDTLVRPSCPVRATEIHGLEDEDVARAPRFDEIAGSVLDALAGRVVVGHCVHLDRAFLRRAIGWSEDPPVIDTISLGPLVGDRRGALSEMCAAVGIPRTGAHAAGLDAVDTARLFQFQLAKAVHLGLRTFGDLNRRAEYAFLGTFRNGFLQPSLHLGRSPHRCSRQRTAAQPPMRVYYDHLLLALADGIVDADETAQLLELQHRLDLPDTQVKALHAQAFAGALLGGAADGLIVDHEQAYLANLARCLRIAGWCPGD